MICVFAGYEDLTAGPAGVDYSKGYNSSLQAQAKPTAAGPGKGERKKSIILPSSLIYPVPVKHGTHGNACTHGNVHKHSQLRDHDVTRPAYSVSIALRLDLSKKKKHDRDYFVLYQDHLLL